MMTPDAWAGAEIMLDESSCPHCQREQCDGECEGSAQIEQPAAVRLMGFRTAADLMAEPPVAAVIESVAYEGSVTVLVAESGAGKTFVMLNMAAAVSGGVSWHDRNVRHGSVAYISFEGDAIGLRLRALHQVGGSPVEHIHVLRASDPISPMIDRDRIEQPSVGERSVCAELDALATYLASAGRPPIVLVILDTIRASLSGSEDSSEHASAYLRAFRRILAKAPGAAGILAHHSGWQDGENQRKRERGSSAWRGNCDCTLYLEAGPYDADCGEAVLTLHARKLRDREPSPPLSLIRRRVALADTDEYGRPRTSCIIEPDQRSGLEREAERIAAVTAESRNNDRKVLTAIRDYPAATNIAALRPFTGLRTATVNDSIARLLREYLITPKGRGQPHRLTPQGHAFLGDV